MLDLGSPLVTLDRVDAVLRGARVLAGISLELRAGESWAIVGPNGSGKSTLLRLVRGDLWPALSSPGARTFHLGGEPSPSPIGARERIALVAPEAQDAYVRRDWDVPVEAVIRSGFFDQLWPQEAATPEQARRVREVAAWIGIAPLLGRSILGLSRGEARKALLARALAPDPGLLLLDEACDGLDGPSRAAFLDLVSHVARAGTPVVMATHRPEEVIPEIRRVAVLDGGRLAAVGGRELLEAEGVPISAGRERDGDLELDRSRAPDRPLTPTLSPASRGRGGDLRDRERDRDSVVTPTLSRASWGRAGDLGQRDRVLFALDDVDVLVEGRPVLAGITWRMRAGEDWAVLGPNGAGKSTFLRLLAGEEQAHAGTVRRLDLGPRASAWDVKSRVALVGPELQARHRHDLHGEEVVLSGFQGSIGLARAPTDAERMAAADVVRWLGMESLAGRRILGLSYGELRKLLLARALVAAPQVLLLDEPVSGLDAASRSWVLSALQRLAEREMHVVLVTHHDDEILRAVNRVARLEAGRMVRQGPR